MEGAVVFYQSCRKTGAKKPEEKKKKLLDKGFEL